MQTERSRYRRRRRACARCRNLFRLDVRSRAKAATAVRRIGIVGLGACGALRHVR
jgi:hypothetical protein